jgi:hypothetical protein
VELFLKVRTVRSMGCLGYFSFYICCAMASCDTRTTERIAFLALKVDDESDNKSHPHVIWRSCKVGIRGFIDC